MPSNQPDSGYAISSIIDAHSQNPFMTDSAIVINEFLVGGIPVEIYSHRDNVQSNLPVNALFLLHGRQHASDSVAHIAKSILEVSYRPGTARKRDLIVVTIIVTTENVSSTLCVTKVGTRTRLNITLITHMYTIQTGTVHDLTFLIDYIPAYLYPQVERNIVEWGVGGVSLGGHSSWIALTREPRIQLSIPIIGCPDYTKLMSHRTQFCGIPFEAPYYPLHLKAYVDAYDPASFPFREKDATNPFLGKRILVLSGAKDNLVPWEASQEFVEGLEVGNGVKKVVLEENAEHECTPSMIQEAAFFVTDWLSR